MSLRKGLFIVIGCLFLVLGGIGIFLPILPTTPFLLVASFCFLKGSTRLHNWLISHPFLGPRIKRIQSGKGLTRKEKIITYLTAAAMITPIIIFTSSLHLRIFLIVLLVVKGIVFLKIKTAGSGTESDGI